MSTFEIVAIVVGVILATVYVRLRKDFDQLTKSHRALQDGLLSPNIRGSMGEKLAEDIIKSFGFIRHQQYRVQESTGTGKPDFTFLFPNELRLNMDCKLKLTNYQRFLECENKSEKDAYQKTFLAEIKESIRSIASKDYIDVSAGTLDFVLMFVANDQIFNFINMADNTLYDYALQKNVVLCSPWSLYAILRVVRIAIENFRLEKGAQELLGLFNEFNAKWGAFGDEIEKIGKGLNTAQKAYKDLTGRRADDFNCVFEKIQRFRQCGIEQK